MEQKQIGVKLSKELEYTKEGDFTTTAELVFTCPTMASFDEASDLSQMVMNALMDAGKNAPKVEEDVEASQGDLDADSIRVVLMTAERVKFKDVAKCFKKLALKCGTFDGKTVLTESTFNKLEIEDFNKCMCEYIANFIVPSLLSGTVGGSTQSTSGSA